MHQVAEAHAEQARRDEQHDRDRQLRGHEAAPEAAIAARQRGPHIVGTPRALRYHQGRTEAERDRQEGRHAHDQRDHGSIEPGIREVRHANPDAVRNRRQQTARGRVTEAECEGGAGQAGHEAFHKELAQQARACGAQRGSHGQLRGALDISRQHQEAKIRAHSHEQQGHRDQQPGQNRLHVAEQGLA